MGHPRRMIWYGRCQRDRMARAPRGGPPRGAAAGICPERRGRQAAGDAGSAQRRPGTSQGATPGDQQLRTLRLGIAR